MAFGSTSVVTAGSWARLDGEARFTPRFAGVAGTTYVVLGRESADERWSELVRVLVPDVGLLPNAVVESIDPGGEWVPANLLRVSVTFSASMGEGSAAGRIHLLDEAGAEILGALMEMPPELWDREHRRLTILLEPGRIKRGLQPNLQAGPPLREGEKVTLVVDSDIRDARGASLRAGASRSYRVGAPVRSRVDPGLWQVRWPREPNDPLVIGFDRPLDRALVQRCLRVVDGNGHPLPGRASLDADARHWAFTPADMSGDFALHIDTRLEDLAGNSVRRVFDRDLQHRGDDGIEAAVVVLGPEARNRFDA